MTPTEELMQEAKRQGFTVYAPENLTTYFYITKGGQIGYCQHDRITGPKFSTVHKPCKHAGTGYEAANMNEAISHRPCWASSDEPVTKYKNTADFLASHWQPLKQY